MKVDFAESIRQSRDQAGKPIAGHPAGVGEAEDLIRGGDAQPVQRTRGGGAERPKDQRDRAAITRLADEPQHLEAIRGKRLKQRAEDDGMQMEMRVPIDVARWKTERAEACELRGDLLPKRLRRARVERVTQASARRGFRETSRVVGDRRDLARPTVAEREVEADAKLRIPLRNAHRFLGGRRVHHEARLSQHSRVVQPLDRFIDRGAAAEIVASENEPFQGGAKSERGAARRRKA